jgi:predicted nuclease with TOPRIM domain
MKPQARVENAKQNVKDIRVVLRGLRDEIRVQLHLAGMDLKKEWEKLEPRLSEAESMMDAIQAASVATAHDIERRAKKLRDELKILAANRPH